MIDLSLFHPKPAVWGTLVLGLLLAPAVAAGTDEAGTPASGFSNYQNTPVNSVLDIYEHLSGKHLIRDANLATVPPISINATGLSESDMLKLIEATLLLNGVAIVPVDAHTAKVVTVGAAKNPRSEGVKVYANATDLPDDDEVISYYMPLDYISAQEAQTIFTQDVPPHPYGAYVVVPSAQAVLLTESTSVIRQLIATKELIDAPPAKVASQFVQLNRADAEKVADLLTKLLDKKSDNAAGAPTGKVTGGDAIVPADLGNNTPLSNERDLVSGPVQIIPDTRSNRLLVVTRPVNMPYLKELISELDQSDTSTVPQRRELKYVLAQDILPALESALAQGKDEEAEVQKQGSGSNPGQNPTQNANNNIASNSNMGGNGGSGNISAVTAPLQSPPQDNVPTVVSIGKTRIMADNRSNSVTVFGSPDAVEKVFGMIDVLDRKPLQVYLSTVIGELTVSKGLDFGIDILQKFQHVGTFGGASGLVTPGTAGTGSGAVPEPGSLLSSTGFPLPSGLTLYGAIGNTIDAYLRALETTNRFKVISRPSVYTTNNKLAVIASGSQVPVPSNTTSGFTGSSNDLTTTSSITYQDVLLQLDIIPLINANHQVTLKIRQTNNTLGSSTVISGNSIPTINTQEINTEVTVPDKSTIVIGGLITDNKTDTGSGVPWLSDIPGLGYLFKETTKSTERDELIIMIQPTVVDTDADQLAVNAAEESRSILGRDALNAAGGSPGPSDHPEIPVARPADSKDLEDSSRSETVPSPSRAFIGPESSRNHSGVYPPSASTVP